MGLGVIGSKDHEIRRTLDRVNWNFPGSTTPVTSIHRLHWFPGNFLPQLPMYLVQVLSQPGDIVLDTFAGSGTTGIEAMLLGREAIMGDLSRASIQVMAGKTALVSRATRPDSLTRFLDQLMFDALVGSDEYGRNGEGSSAELEQWYSPATLHQLRGVWQLVETVDDYAARAILELLFTDTLFACASTVGAATSSGGRRRHHWGWVADNVTPKPPHAHDVVPLMRVRIHAALRARDATGTATATASILRMDARAVPVRDQSADLVVTSPPYIGMIDYTMANRLTHLWMGWDLVSERTSEIGARYRRNRRDLVEHYSGDLRRSFSEIRRTLKPGGICAVVIGNSRKFPDVSSSALNELAETLKIIAGPYPRTPTRRRVSERRGTAPTEYVAVLRNE